MRCYANPLQSPHALNETCKPKTTQQVHTAHETAIIRYWLPVAQMCQLEYCIFSSPILMSIMTVVINSTDTLVCMSITACLIA